MSVPTCLADLVSGFFACVFVCVCVPECVCIREFFLSSVLRVCTCVCVCLRVYVGARVGCA